MEYDLDMGISTVQIYHFMQILFFRLFIGEALKLNKENLFLEFVENDRLLFSDGFPILERNILFQNQC